MTRVIAKWMRCPHCQEKFSLTEKQLVHNLFFACPHCRRRNSGFYSAEEDGTLIGQRKEV